MWAAFKWLLAMLCGGIMIVLLSKTCSFDPERESLPGGQEAKYDVADSAPDAQRGYTLDEVPNPKDQEVWNWVSNPDGILRAETVEKINGLLTELEDSLSIEVAVFA